MWIVFIFALLTLLSQIGGCIYLLSILLHRRFKTRSQVKFLGLFVSLYLFCTFVITPPVAKMLGRKALPLNSNGLVIPNHPYTYLLNRHYVKPEMYRLIHESAERFNDKRRGPLKLRYLDANFPFINGFPLLPHRSHDDGEKLDIAFLYANRADHTYWDDRVSLTGYGFCEGPFQGEQNMPDQCRKKGYWQYSLLTKIFGLGSQEQIHFDEDANTALLQSLSSHPSTRKIFIEPHLKQRLGFGSDPKLRFHGCAAVRHDDHIHLEL